MSRLRALSGYWAYTLNIQSFIYVVTIIFSRHVAQHSHVRKTTPAADKYPHRTFPLLEPLFLEPFLFPENRCALQSSNHRQGSLTQPHATLELRIPTEAVSELIFVCFGIPRVGGWYRMPARRRPPPPQHHPGPPLLRMELTSWQTELDPCRYLTGTCAGVLCSHPLYREIRVSGSHPSFDS